MNKSVSHLRAICFALCGFALWVGTDTCMKLAGEASLPPQEVVAFMGICGALLMAGQASLRGKLQTVWPKNPKHQMGRALLGLFTLICNAIALKHLPLTLFYVTVFTAPMMIAVLAFLFLKEHLTIGKSIAVIAGFMGVMVAINPFQDFSQGEWIGYIAAFLGTVSFAISTTWVRHLSQSDTPESIAFFTPFVQGIACSLACLWQFVPINGYLFAILFLMSALCLIGNLAFFSSLKYTTAANVSQFHYTQIVTGALLGYLIWHDVPKSEVWMGAAIIITSGLYIANHARKQQLLVSPH